MNTTDTRQRDVLGRFPVGLPVKRYRFRAVAGKLELVHRIRAEKALGKPLPVDAVVHHADGSKSEFAPLVICQDESYHRLLHARMRIKAAGGDPNTERICAYCGELKPLNAFVPSAALLGKWHCSRCPAKALQQKIARGQRSQAVSH